MNNLKSKINQIKTLEDGFCNPTKYKVAQEIRQNLVDDIMNRGWTYEEAKQMINEQE